MGSIGLHWIFIQNVDALSSWEKGPPYNIPIDVEAYIYGRYDYPLSSPTSACAVRPWWHEVMNCSPPGWLFDGYLIHQDNITGRKSFLVYEDFPPSLLAFPRGIIMASIITLLIVAWNTNSLPNLSCHILSWLIKILHWTWSLVGFLMTSHPGEGMASWTTWCLGSCMPNLNDHCSTSVILKPWLPHSHTCHNCMH